MTSVNELKNLATVAPQVSLTTSKNQDSDSVVLTGSGDRLLRAAKNTACGAVGMADAYAGFVNGTVNTVKDAANVVLRSSTLNRVALPTKNAVSGIMTSDTECLQAANYSQTATELMSLAVPVAAGVGTAVSAVRHARPGLIGQKLSQTFHGIRESGVKLAGGSGADWAKAMDDAHALCFRAMQEQPRFAQKYIHNHEMYRKNAGDTVYELKMWLGNLGTGPSGPFQTVTGKYYSASNKVVFD